MKIKGVSKRLIQYGLIFFISGIAGLIYEVVWERLLELYFGVTNVSIILIVSAYMAGLGLGSLAGGQISNRITKPLIVYGFIELAIASFGIFSPQLIIWVGSATAGAPYPLVFLLSFGILLIPTFLMGMTLPLLVQAFVERVAQAGEIVGLLYGINTLGAATGAFLSGFLLISISGIDGAAYIASGLNVISGLAAIIIYLYDPERLPAVNRMEGDVRLIKDSTHRHNKGKYAGMLFQNAYPGFAGIILISFMVGFLGLGYEMLWIRMLAIINKNTVYGFPTILGIFLGGLALGGYYFGKRADRANDPYQLFWKLETAAALTAGASILIYYLAMEWEPISTALQTVFGDAQRPEPAYVLVGGGYVFSKLQFIKSMAYFLLPVTWLILPASFFLGGGLPVLDRIAIQKADAAGRWVGNVHVANIFGSVIGSLLVSFVLLDRLGSELTLKLLILLTIGFILLSMRDRRYAAGKNWRSQTTALLAIITTAVITPGNKEFYFRYFQAGTGAQTAMVEEYADGVLALTDGFLWIKGDEHGSYPSDGSYESNVLACLGAAQPRRVLIIGLGGGNSAYFISKVAGIEEIVIVELMEGLDEFLDRNILIVHELLADPRVRYISDDGRRYLYTNPEQKFDLVFIDPLRNHTSGHDSLYSVEALSLYRDHLTEKGIFCEWHDENRIIPFTSAQVFPQVDAFREFTTASNQVILYEVEFMNAIVENYLQVAGDHLQKDAEKQLQANQVLLSFVRDREQILTDEHLAPVLTDLNPWLEYYLFRKPQSIPIRTSLKAYKSFMTRLVGCDEFCSKAVQQRADALQ